MLPDRQLTTGTDGVAWADEIAGTAGAAARASGPPLRSTNSRENEAAGKNCSLQTRTLKLYWSRARLSASSALCIVHPITNRARLSRAGRCGWPAARQAKRQGCIRKNQHLNYRNYLNSPASPSDSGSAAEAALRPPAEMPEMPQNHLAALRPVQCRSCRDLADIIRPLPVPQRAETSMARRKFLRDDANAIRSSLSPSGPP
jgi:hypothetical protein